MSTIDKINYKGTLLDIADAEARADVSDLKGAVTVNPLLNGWDTVNHETGYINSNGGVTANGSFWHTDYIPVSEGDEIAYKLLGYQSLVYIVTGYDSSKSKVTGADVVGSSSWTAGTYTVPSGVAFVRICSDSVTASNLYFRSTTVYGTAGTPLKDYADEQDAKKVDIQQSTEDAGKALVIGNDGKLAPGDVSIDIDATLTQEGEAADAKAVGDAIAAVESVLDEATVKQKLNGWDSVKWQTGYINSSGTVTPNGSFRNTDFIPVNADDEISYKLMGFSTVVWIITGYDSSKARVSNASVIGSSSLAEGTYTVPSGVAYVRLCSDSGSNVGFQSETILGTTVENTQKYIDDECASLSVRITENTEELATYDGIETIKDYYTTSPNLYDPSKAVVGTTYTWTDYMPVEEGKRYTQWADGPVYQLYWYNSSKTEISHISADENGREAVAPENAVYARLYFANAGVTKIMFAEGCPGDYVPYGILIPKEYLPDYVARDTNNLNNTHKFAKELKISTINGRATYSHGSSVTDFIPVEEGKTYYFGGEGDGLLNITGGAAYDASYEFIEGISSSSSSYTASTGVAFIRLGYSTPDGTIFAPCVREGNTWVTGLSKFDPYDTFRIVNAKPTEYEQQNGLYGLMWNAMGDSITEGSGTTKTYMSFISERTGINVRNYGMSNTAIARRGASYTNDMCIRYSTMNDDADIITVFGGTNDHGNNIPIGEWGDNTPDTLYGAMTILVEGLTEKYIGKSIGFILPLPKYINNTDFSYPSASFMPYIECIKDVCKRYSIPVLDLYTESGISVSMASVRTAMIPDGLHPNALGHELISWKIQRFLESLR